MATTDHCRNCGTAFNLADAVCPRCGTTVPAATGDTLMECQNHLQQPAVACCTVCGKPVCGDCATTRDGIFFCNSPGHQGIHADWLPFMTLKSEFESDMICRNLQQAGIETAAFAQHAHSEAFWLGDRRTVKVFVRRDSLQASRALLESLGLYETITQ